MAKIPLKSIDIYVPVGVAAKAVNASPNDCVLPLSISLGDDIIAYGNAWITKIFPMEIGGKEFKVTIIYEQEESNNV